MQLKIERMKGVLRKLGLTNAENVVQLKGRVAGAISTSSNELLVTELIFTNVFKGMNAELKSQRSYLALFTVMVVQKTKMTPKNACRASSLTDYFGMAQARGQSDGRE